MSLVKDYQKAIKEVSNLESKEQQKVIPTQKQSLLLGIYAGSGGNEAQDFAQIIQHMLLAYCKQKGLQTELLSQSSTPSGLRSAEWKVHGKDAWDLIRPEHGSHRLSRRSPFDKAKRRQTSFVRVEVLPFQTKEAIDLDQREIEISRFKGSGPGGQHRNKTETGIRAKHLPTGLEAVVSSGRSLLANQEAALSVLKARLDHMQAQTDAKENAKFKGEAAEFGKRIRSYILFPKPLVCDHRSGNKSGQVKQVLNGDLDLIR